jgi:hypothetical protein
MFVIETDMQLVALPSLNGSLFGSTELRFLMFSAHMVTEAEKCSECQVDGDAAFLPDPTFFQIRRPTKVLVHACGGTYL